MTPNTNHSGPGADTSKRFAPSEVSVLLPARSADGQFRTAIESIASQTFRNFDLVIVAPEAGHDEMLRVAIALGLTRTTMVADPGRGLARALNAGLKHCQAPLVARMDADDECHAERLQRQVIAFASRSELSVLGTAADLIDSHSRVVGHRCASGRPLVRARELLFGNPLVHPSVMFRLAAVNAAGGYNPDAIAEDYDLWLRMSARGDDVAVLPEALLRYRIHPGQLSFQAAGPKRCRQIAQTIRTHMKPTLGFLASVAAVSWTLRGTLMACRARLARIRARQ